MKLTVPISTLSTLMAPLFLLYGCIQQHTNEQELSAEPVVEAPSWTAEEQEVIEVVEQFLEVAGIYDLPAMDAMMAEKANVGIVGFRDTAWKATFMTFDEYFEAAANRETRPYLEPVREYAVHVTEGHLAFVKADAILYTFGVPRSNNVDYFTMLRDEGDWKIISASYTPIPLPEEERVYDPEMFGKGYARAWCSQKPEYVAMFFAGEGSLTVNNGQPAVGREAVAGVAESFMTAFPDMVVLMDSLVQTAEGTAFHWTLTGTNTGPGGTGNKVRISGVERWTLDEEGLIRVSDGSFDEKEYNRQLVEGAPL